MKEKSKEQENKRQHEDCRKENESRDFLPLIPLLFLLLMPV
jgi:hypothetical protein